MSDTMPEDTTNSTEIRRLQWKAHGDFCRFRSVNDTFRKYCPDMDQKSVLDIGCGRTYPQVLLYTLMGLEAIGIDRGEFAWSTDRQADDLIFFEHLAKMIDRTLDDQAVSLVRTDAARLPFADNRFDFIVSNMVFEHLGDLDAVTDEMARVLKPTGLMNIGIHLYPSLSGQHHPGIWGEEITELPEGIEPWYHLRNLPGPIDHSLNMWRECQYRELFETRFDLLEVQHPTFEQGRRFLSSQILQELPGFSAEELLRPWAIFVARNR